MMLLLDGAEHTGEVLLSSIGVQSVALAERAAHTEVPDSVCSNVCGGNRVGLSDRWVAVRSSMDESRSGPASSISTCNRAHWWHAAWVRPPRHTATTLAKASSALQPSVAAVGAIPGSRCAVA